MKSCSARSLSDSHAARSKPSGGLRAGLRASFAARFRAGLRAGLGCGSVRLCVLGIGLGLRCWRFWRLRTRHSGELGRASAPIQLPGITEVQILIPVAAAVLTTIRRRAPLPEFSVASHLWERVRRGKGNRGGEQGRNEKREITR